jgi:cytoskeletal protein CcmA (bactofilin family)
MWNKTTPEKEQPPQRPVAQPRPVAAEPVRPISTPPAPAAVIGKTMVIKGEVRSQEDLVIEGEVEGKVELNSRLTIGPGGKINANLKAKEVIVHGSVHGNVEAADKIQIRAGASIVGDIKTAGIVIDDGAYFKGGIDIIRPEAGRKAATAS